MRNHHFVVKKLILDENLWFLKNLSLIGKRKKDILLPDSKMYKSHQIEPKDTGWSFAS